MSWLELAGLSLSVSVLTPPAPMRFDDEADLLAQLRPGVDGLIIEDLGRRSLFLPSVWEEMPDRRQFLMALKLKAGLRADHFSPRLPGAAVPLDRGEGGDGAGERRGTRPAGLDGAGAITPSVGQGSATK